MPEGEINGDGYVVHTLEASLWCLLRVEIYREVVLTLAIWIAAAAARGRELTRTARIRQAVATSISRTPEYIAVSAEDVTGEPVGRGRS